MKTLQILATIAFTAFSIMLTACATDPVEAVGITNSKNSFDVLGDDYFNAPFKGFSADTASSAKDIAGVGTIYFSGLTSKTDEAFVMVLTADQAAIGTYTIGAGYSRMTLAIGDQSQNRMYEAVSGAFQISTWDAVGGKAKGTFNGIFVRSEVPDTMKVSNGKFDVDRE